VVDEDVDIRSAQDVEWAMATRLDASKGIVKLDDVFGHGLNPSFPDYLGPKVGFDCTKPFPASYEYERAAYKKMALDTVTLDLPEVRAIAPAKEAKKKKNKKAADKVSAKDQAAWEASLADPAPADLKPIKPRRYLSDADEKPSARPKSAAEREAEAADARLADPLPWAGDAAPKPKKSREDRLAEPAPITLSDLRGYDGAVANRPSSRQKTKAERAAEERNARLADPAPIDLTPVRYSGGADAQARRALAKKAAKPASTGRKSAVKKSTRSAGKSGDGAVRGGTA
jgi:hypothetical protein